MNYVLRIPPENMNLNDELSVEQLISYYSYRFPIPNDISLCCIHTRSDTAPLTPPQPKLLRDFYGLPLKQF